MAKADCAGIGEGFPNMELLAGGKAEVAGGAENAAKGSTVAATGGAAVVGAGWLKRDGDCEAGGLTNLSPHALDADDDEDCVEVRSS